MPVYIIRAGQGDMVKIGWTKGEPLIRLKAIQASNHEPLTIIRLINHMGEDLMHRRFRDQHIRGEWFLFHPDMLTISIDELRDCRRIPLPDELNRKRSPPGYTHEKRRINAAAREAIEARDE